MNDSQLKQRLIGAAVLIVLAVIFLPMLLDGDVGSALAPTNIPPKPETEFVSKVTPLDEVPPAAADEPPQAQAEFPPAESLAAAPAMPPAASAPVAQVANETVATPPAENSEPQAPPKPAAEKTPDSVPPAASTAKTDAPPKPAAPRADTKRMDVDAWVVQLGSFSSEQNASKLRDQLRDKGYSAFVETVAGSGGGKVFRVRVGPELERARAEAVRDKLEKELKIKGIVGRYPS
ncbi:MAG: SPOR domain-containing protein [Pseudomonadota bacterium]